MYLDTLKSPARNVHTSTILFLSAIYLLLVTQQTSHTKEDVKQKGQTKKKTKQFPVLRVKEKQFF